METTETKQGRGQGAVLAPYKEIAPSFGPWLRRARESRGMMVKDFASAAGLGRSTVHDLEQGRSGGGSVAVHTFQRLALGMGLDLGYVLHKAGFEVGVDGVNLARLAAVEEVLSLLDGSEPLLRRAMAEAVEALDVLAPDAAEDVRRALVRYDLVVERLRDRRGI